MHTKGQRATLPGGKIRQDWYKLLHSIAPTSHRCLVYISRSVSFRVQLGARVIYFLLLYYWSESIHCAVVP